MYITDYPANLKTFLDPLIKSNKNIVPLNCHLKHMFTSYPFMIYLYRLVFRVQQFYMTGHKQF